ncbi:hypothetical protein LCGC14_1675860 [marine sediment metagenome]|uniref:Uncharacterized protein n=1 Tax=marine sediment metagenome TaxID=412755 RepID=A0A0F9HQ30_9ZZZZ
MSSRNLKGRVLWHSLATSRKWTALPGTACTPREIFTLIVAAVDNLGRMQACPVWWKSEVYRTRPDVTPDKIAIALEHNHNVGLIYIYENEGRPILQTDEPQLSGNMLALSKFEDCTDDWEKHLTEEPINFVKYQHDEGLYGINYCEYLPSVYSVYEKNVPKGLKVGGRRFKGRGFKECSKAGFDKFWSAYPRKVSKVAARRAWSSVEASLETVLEALEVQKPQWKDPQFIPHPATWLNGQRWEDEQAPEATLPESMRRGK